MAVKDIVGEVRPGLFARKATGLVREVGTFDLFAYSVNNQNIGLGVLFMLLFVPAFYLGADLIWSVVIAGVLSFFPVAAFGLLNTIMPRSGGDYVWNSRVFGPWVGWAMSWTMVIWMWFYIGAPLALVTKYGVASLLRYIGAMTGNLRLVVAGEWFYSPWGQVVLGTILLILFVYLFITGTKRYMRLQNILFVIATIGLVLAVVVMLGTSNAQFETRFNDYVVTLGGSSDAFAQVETTAAADPDIPLEIPSGINVGQTFQSTVWAIYIMMFAYYAAYMGGEVKSARKTNIVALPVSVIYVTAIVAIVLAVFLAVPGVKWLAALSYFDPDNFMPTSESIGEVLGMRAFVPHFSELAAIAAPPLVGILIGIGFIFWTHAWMPVSILSSTRPVMAWSFDRLFPEKLSEVHPKYHTPVYAILLGAVMGWISLVLFAFGVMGLLSGTFAEFVVLGVVCAAAIVLPYVRKDLFEASPVAWRVAGIPVLTIVGALGLIAIVYMCYLLIVDPIIGLAFEPIYLYTNLGTIALGFILYPIIRAWRRRQGVDIELAAKEIPPE